MGAKLCLESGTFRVDFIALDNHWMHAPMFNTFCTRCVNFCTEQKNVHLYRTPTLNFSLFSEALSTVHFTVQNVDIFRCGQCTVSTSLLLWLHSLFFHINKIHLLNASTK